MQNERRPFLVMYAGGNSIPHEKPNRNTRDWGEFFEAQTLVKENLGNGHTRRVVFKSSEISPTGVMVIETAPADRDPIRNLSYLSRSRTLGHLEMVRNVMDALKNLNPDADLYLWHLNATDEKQFPYPTYFGNPLKSIPTRNSQTVGTLHSHVDALNIDQAIKVDSLPNLANLQRTRIHDETGNEQKLKNFIAEKRRQERPRVFHRFVREIFNSEVVPYLISVYPDLFEVTEYPPDNLPAPLPELSLKLKVGFAELNTERFAIALKDVHNLVIQQWSEVAKLIDNDQYYETYAKNHPWISHFQEILPMLRRVIVKDRKRVDRQNWLHKRYNFTLGIAEWREQDAVFFINPTPDVNAGVEAVHLHSVREIRDLTEEEIDLRNTFRTILTKSLITSQPHLQLGAEGKYLLTKKTARIV